MKKKRFLILFLLVFIVSLGGYLGKNIFQLSLTDQIYVGQMAMEDSDLVVGRDNQFPKSRTSTLDAQLLFSIWNRIENTSSASQRLVVSDFTGNIVLDRNLTSSGYSTVVSLPGIQQKSGKYLLTWYVNDKAITYREIIIEE